jgi:hypothetical protein
LKKINREITMKNKKVNKIKECLKKGIPIATLGVAAISTTVMMPGCIVGMSPDFEIEAPDIITAATVDEIEDTKQQSIEDCKSGEWE